jgi:hypothetical protein
MFGFEKLDGARVVKNLPRLFKSDAMVGRVERRLLSIPLKPAVVEGHNVSLKINTVMSISTTVR